MKYDLDDLLLKSFEKREKAPPEFSKSVMEKMQASSGGKRRKTQQICAAACIGMILLSVAALLAWKADSGVNVEKQPVRWVKSESQGNVAQVPHADSEQSGIIGESPNVSDGKDEAQKNALGDRGSEGERQEGFPASTGLPDISEESSDASKRNASVNHPERERRLSANASDKSVKIQSESDVRKTKDQSASSKNQVKKPSAATENKPGTLVKPDDIKRPGTTRKPEATMGPTGSGQPVSVKDYTRLCSMQCVRPEGEDAEKISLEFSSLIDKGVLEDQLITSYDQLQGIIRTIQKEHSYWHVIKWLVEPLKKYDRAYFRENVLYFYNVYWTMGYDFSLSSATLVEEEGGRKELKIELEHFWALPADLCAPCVMCYYGSFIQIPRDVAEKCDAIECSLIGGVKE